MVALNYGNFQTFGASASLAVGNSLYVDAVNGNDSTAKRGSLGAPFLTIAAALAAASAGDILYIGPGAYNLGANGHLRWSTANLSLIGCGFQSIITYTGTTLANGCLLNPGPGALIQSLHLKSSGPTNSGILIGSDENLGDTTNDGVLIRDCWIDGSKDAIYFADNPSGTSPYAAFTWKFFDCTINSTFDCTQSTSFNGSATYPLSWPARIEYHNCSFASLGGSNANDVRCIVNSSFQNWANVLFDCTLNATTTASAHNARPVYNQDGGIVEIHGGSISGAATGGGGGAYSAIYQGQLNSSGVAPACYIDSACRYDPSTIANDGAAVIISGPVSQIFGTAGATIAIGTGAGTGATATLSAGSDDLHGQITIVTAATPATSATVCTFTFGKPKSASFPTITPANAAAQALAAAALVAIGSSSGTSFTLKSGSTALATATTYVFNYTA